MPTVSIYREVRAVASLQPHPQNTKLHGEAQVQNIAASIAKFGFRDPIGILPNGVIVEGEGRWRAAQLAGLGEVPVIVLDGLSEAEADRYRIAHNKLTLSTGFDMEKLLDSLREITGADATIDARDLGFDDKSGANILSSFSGGTVSSGPVATNAPAGAANKPVAEIVWDTDTQKATWDTFLKRAAQDFPGLSEAEALTAFIERSGVFAQTHEEQDRATL